MYIYIYIYWSQTTPVVRYAGSECSRGLTGHATHSVQQRMEVVVAERRQPLGRWESAYSQHQARRQLLSYRSRDEEGLML